MLIAAITIGTTIMAGNFRERALTSRERELENTVLLLARHFDQHLNDFTIVEKDLAAQIQSTGITSDDPQKRKLATLEWHEVLKSQGRRLFRCRRHQCVRCGRNTDQFVGDLAGSRNQHRRPSLSSRPSNREPRPRRSLIELVQGRFAEGWATVIAHKVVGQNGEFLGIVTRAIAPASFEKFFESHGAWRRRGDFDVPSRRNAAGALSACRGDDRSELQDRSNSPPDIVEVGPWDDALDPARSTAWTGWLRRAR